MTAAVQAGLGVLLAPVAVGLAVALLVPGRALVGRSSGSVFVTALPLSRVPTGAWWPMVVGAGVWLTVGPVAGVVAGVAAVAVRRTLRARRRHRAKELASVRALEACVVLADEVRSGHSGVAALRSAAEVDPELEPAYAAAVVGADVSLTLKKSGVGVPEYRFLAAAWQVSARHGGGLADALDRVVAQGRADRATARVVASELASARSTARLLVALPFFALLVGAGSGGRPWEFLLETTPGVVCLALGGVLAWAGLAWIDAIAAGVT